VQIHKVTKLPYRGAPQTVGLLRQTALRSQRLLPVRLLAEKVCEHVRSKDYLSEYIAIYNYVLAHTRYMRDPRTVELVRDPYIVADAMLKGEVPCLDCDDMTALLTALFLSVGAQVRIVTVAFRHMFFRGERQYSHVYVQALEPRGGAWVTFDPVAGLQSLQMMKRTVAAKFWPVA
jgi:hypothetical protein